MTPDTCSPTSSEDSESWDDLPLFSSKMLREYSAPSSTAPSGQTHKAHPFCSMSSASWSAWVIEQRQEYSARAKQAPPTSENGCSFLVYEMISEQEGAILFQDCSRTQSHQVLAPTLGPQDEEPRNTHGSPHESQSGSPTGQLNPRWVETLMGLPVGWTMVSCAAPWTIEPMNCGSSATGSSPQPQSELSESSGSAWATPRAGACGMTARTSGRPIEKSGILQTQVYLEECKAWGTPRVGTAKAPQGGGNGDDAPYRLENQVQAWGTPQARDWKGPSGRALKGTERDLPLQVREHSVTRTK